MDGPFWVDTRAPHISADVASVTLASTNKALVPVANLPVLGANYFSYIGKACRLTMFGRATVTTTPGNLQFSWLWGNGADANGTVIGTSAALAMTASQTNLSWMTTVIVRCRALGASGSLLVTGNAEVNNALIASTLQPILIPASAPAPVTVDLTAANVISPQISQSGTPVGSVQVHDFLFESLN